MARSVQQVTQSIINTFQQINPSLDLLVGPTYDYTIAPVPTEISFCEQSVQRMLIYYSANFPSVATTDEATNLATNFGITVSQGEYASGPVTFFRNTPPPAGTTIVIPVGQLVATQDFQYMFQVTDSVTMLGDYANTYYNPSTNRYEITVVVQAVLPGSIYNIPSNRLTQLVSGVASSFSGVSQLVAMGGGTDSESTTDLATRVVQQFKGINLNSVTGLATLASRFAPTQIIDTSVVRPTDRLEFQRPTNGPAIDLCIYGNNNQNFTEEYFARGGETSFVMQTSTAISVLQVQVNGTILDTSQWTFLPDTSLAYQYSTRASNTIQLVNALNQYDIVNITGQRNYLLDSVQSLVLPDDDSIFQTDVLVRAFVPLPITVSVNVQMLNSAFSSVTDLQDALRDAVNGYIQPQYIPQSLDPSDFQTFLQGTLQNVQSITVLQFRRTRMSVSSAETIYPLKNQQPVLDTASSSLVVIS